MHCLGESKLAQPLWKTVWSFLKKLKIEPLHNPAVPVYLLKGSEIIMSIHCSIIYNSQDMEKTQMIIKRRMDKENVVDMQYYLATKKEILPCVTIQMDLEGIVLREIRERRTNTI